MNYRCVCKNCGEIYYSATSINYHVEKRCQKCGDELIEFSNKPKLGLQRELTKALDMQRKLF